MSPWEVPPYRNGSQAQPQCISVSTICLQICPPPPASAPHTPTPGTLPDLGRDPSSKDRSLCGGSEPRPLLPACDSESLPGMASECSSEEAGADWSPHVPCAGPCRKEDREAGAVPGEPTWCLKACKSDTSSSNNCASPRKTSRVNFHSWLWATELSAGGRAPAPFQRGRWVSQSPNDRSQAQSGAQQTAREESGQERHSGVWTP